MKTVIKYSFICFTTALATLYVRDVYTTYKFIKDISAFLEEASWKPSQK